MGMPTISHSDTTLCQALTDMVQAIALEEAAIAHILNAEGEKLQRALQIQTISVSELLSINQSVLTMIEHLNDLEGVILAKLDKIDFCRCNGSIVINQCSDE